MSRHRYAAVCALFFVILVCASAANEYDDQGDVLRARRAAKPWLMRRLVINDNLTLPVSPASLITMVIGIGTIISIFFSMFPTSSWAEASHILIPDHSKDTQSKLQELRQAIGTNERAFGEYASKHSSCPSKQSQGFLGRFNPGDMAPAFDKAVFSSSSPVGATIGPVETQFGWHLIFIRDRKI